MKELITQRMEEIRVQYLIAGIVLDSVEVYDIAVAELTERTQYV